MAIMAGAESSPLADDLGVAIRLAEAAAEVALGFFNRGVESTLKDDGTPVTDADFAVEATLIRILAGERPTDGVVSEEGGSRPGASRRWILDPIDGTVNFAVGDPNWGTHVALEIDDDLAVGVITLPVAGETWWGVRGGGAFLTCGSANPVRFQVSGVDRLSQARLSMWPASPDRRLEALRAAAMWVEPDWTLIKRLLQGKLDAVVAAAGGIWDHAPAVLLVHEAGGGFCDHNGGSRLDGGGGIYSNGHLHDQLKALLIRE
jgi:histidinol-phosphatase